MKKSFLDWRCMLRGVTLEGRLCFLICLAYRIYVLRGVGLDIHKEINLGEEGCSGGEIELFCGTHLYH